MSRAADPDALLARLGFADVRRTAELLGPGGPLRLWDSGPVDAGAAAVLAQLGGSANPDLAAAQLNRLAAAVAKPAVLGAAIRSDRRLRERLVAVLASSTLLGDHLVRHPRLWPDLPSDRPPGLGHPADPDALGDAYRTALVRLAARDLTGDLAVADVAGRLSDLAAAALQAGLDMSGVRAPLAVVGMGKCGGRELNYVSDVDVVFVTADEADLQEATRAANATIRACAGLWPVDAALRPEGRAGPLVRTLASHEAYYRRWAKTWEFQALLKARPVAGDPGLGREYVERIAPLVWSAGERPDFVDEIRAMKQRVEGSVPAGELDRQIKLAPGGLRDVEFAVQLLQLVHGRADETLRTGNTLEALHALGEGGYASEEDVAGLAEAYRFLRRVEHRLQLQRLRRTHTIPADPAALLWLARAMGHQDVEEFRREQGRHAVDVRRLHEKLFYRPLLSAVARLPADRARLAAEPARTWLEALGFADPARALTHIEALTTGLSRRAVVLRTMLPVMLPWFADAHDPDAGLLAFRNVAEQLGSSPWFLALLRDSEVAAERLARLLAASRYVADLLGRAPEAVGTVASDDELRPRAPLALRTELLSVVARHDDAEMAVASVRALRRQELLRVACADLLGLVGVRDVGHALTAAAEATVAAGLAAATRQVGLEGVRLAVVGMGRFGGWEQGYGSDADVLFVHEPLPGTPDAAAAAGAKAVAEELRRLLAVPAPDPPLLVDAGLRPEGRQGPLTLSLAGYARYSAARAAVWEAQALLRARFVAGDAELGGRFEELIAPVRWPARFGADQIREVRRIKARVEAERLPRGADRALHTKLGVGGLADVEWTVQLLQLRHAHAVPELRTPGTLDALAAAAAAGLLSAGDAEVLAAAWRAATRARNAVMLVRGRPADALPADARTLAGVARAVGYPAGSRGNFLDGYRRATRRARVVVERIFYA